MLVPGGLAAPWFAPGSPGAPAPSTFNYDAVDLDGTNDYMERGADLTGISDGKAGTLSVWIRLDGGDGTNRRLIANDTPRFRSAWGSGNILNIVGANSADSTILNLASATAHLAGGTWYNALSSWNLAIGAGHLYINDVDDLAVGPTLTDDTIDYTGANWAIGSLVGGSQKFNGCMAEFYFTNTYIDLSITANRRKFITATGAPEDLGPTGNLPTGTSALVYQHVAAGGSASDFGPNQGTGGGWTITGSLDLCSSKP